MLDSLFFANSRAEKYYDDPHYNIWKFPAKPEAGKPQEKPIVLNYSIMTRAYGACFNDDSFIDIFNHHGFDVYLMDWGKDFPAAITGWRLDDLAGKLHDAVKQLLEKYEVSQLNIFGICIGGLIVSHLINMRPEPDYAARFHKIAYYGSPILGARDLGMAQVFSNFYKYALPYRESGSYLNMPMGILDGLIMAGTSSAMLVQSWQEFWQEGPKTFLRLMALSWDDRWIPFAAFMDLLQEAFASQGVQDSAEEEQFHFTKPMDHTYFFNLVGARDSQVMPSASIVDWNSSAPNQFKKLNSSKPGFEQVIFPGGHFIFAQPGFRTIKDRLARWFKYYPHDLDNYPYGHSRHTRSI